MALVNLLSYTIADADGDTKTMPIYFPAPITIAEAQAWSDAVAPDLDAAIDGKIVSAQVQLAIDLPGGLKGSAVAGSEVQRGALLAFNAADTDYRHSIFVPSWEDAGFSGNAVVTTGVYATLIGDLWDDPTSGGIVASDKYGNDLTSFIEGRKTFRK